MISIIIPTYNRASVLKETLSSIYSLVNLNEVEIIVVDNGSTDATKEVCKKFIDEKTPAIQYYFDAEPGLLTGRHLGASVAKGEILCFIDDDVQLSPFWLNGVRNAFKDSSVQLATGPCLPKFEVYPPSWIDAFWDEVYEGKFCGWLSLLDLGNKQIDIHPNYVFGLNFCIRRSALKALKGFHPDTMPPNLQHLQGDGETGLSLKAFSLNYRSIYHPEILLYHMVLKERLTVEYFEKRAFFQGVCNSFSLLKSQITENNELASTKKTALAKRIIPALKRRVKGVGNLFVSKEILNLKAALNKKEREGFYFHQEAFKTNETVREWVMRKDYLDYRLPEEP